MFTYIHKNTGKTLYLHRKASPLKKSFIWYFSEDPKDAVDLPPFFEVVENPITKYPFVKKKKF